MANQVLTPSANELYSRTGIIPAWYCYYGKEILLAITSAALIAIAYLQFYHQTTPFLVMSSLGGALAIASLILLIVKHYRKYHFTESDLKIFELFVYNESGTVLFRSGEYRFEKMEIELENYLINDWLQHKKKLIFGFMKFNGEEIRTNYFTPTTSKEVKAQIIHHLRTLNHRQ